eukprot:m.225103 g.225103  ORF g.225103 m.225103 type:complete len:52 (+) comp15157_c2_seq6:1516-1671(+)
MCSLDSYSLTPLVVYDVSTPHWSFECLVCFELQPRIEVYSPPTTLIGGANK